MREATGSYCTYSIPGKTATLVPEFTVEDVPSVELLPLFLRLEQRTCPWAEHSDDDDDCTYFIFPRKTRDKHRRYSWILQKYLFHLLSQFNLSLIATFTWLTPPGFYRATTCRERELTLDHIHTLFYHTRTWRASPDEWSVQCRDHLRDNTNMKVETQHHAHIHSNKAKLKGWLWRPNDIRGPCGPKASGHLSYRWEKTQKKPHPGNLSRPGIEPGPVSCCRPSHSGGLFISYRINIFYYCDECDIIQLNIPVPKKRMFNWFQSTKPNRPIFFFRFCYF